jgi:tetratricopeptide (TPR) repeat protein
MINGAFLALMLLYAGPTIAVNVKNDSVVADILKVVAMPASEAGIQRVEFSIDDQLRVTLMKPPFEYKWDTIDENEGRHTLIISAYDTEGKAASKRIKVEIDNQLNLGVKPHADKAIAAFRKGDYDTCYLEGRKAARVKQYDIDAIRAHAAAIGVKGDLNKALDELEKVPIVQNQRMADASLFPLADRAAIELRGAFHLRRAALMPNTAQDKELAAAFDLGRKLAPMVVAEVHKEHPEPYKTAADQFAVGDALFATEDYDGALSVYQGKPASPRDPQTVNRIALAMVYQGRLREAELMMLEYAASDKANDASPAVLGFVYLQQRRYAKARTQVESGANRHSTSCLVVMAHADLALKDFRHAFEELKEASDKADSPEIHYLAAGMFTDTRDLKAATYEAMETLVRVPMYADGYVMRAFQLAALVPTEGLNQSLPIFDLVIEREPKHPGARLGKAIALISQKKYKLADPIARELAKSERNAPDVLVSYAAVCQEANERAKASEALEMAKKLNPDQFADAMIPKMPEFVQRVGRYRRTPMFTPALLVAEENPIQRDVKSTASK